jgi:glutamate--cysteine ligase
LEPGGQFELSGAVKKTIHEVDQEMKSFMQNMKVVCEELGLRLFSIGAAPNWERDEMPIMPKKQIQKNNDALHENSWNTRLRYDVENLYHTSES